MIVVCGGPCNNCHSCTAWNNNVHWKLPVQGITSSPCFSRCKLHSLMIMFFFLSFRRWVVTAFLFRYWTCSFRKLTTATFSPLHSLQFTLCVLCSVLFFAYCRLKVASLHVDTFKCLKFVSGYFNMRPHVRAYYYIKEEGCDGLLTPSYSFHVSLKGCLEDLILSYLFYEMFTEVKSGEWEGQEICALQYILFMETIIDEWLC